MNKTYGLDVRLLPIRTTLLLCASLAMAGCLDSTDADQPSDTVTADSADAAGEGTDRVIAQVFQDGSVALEWPETEGAVEYVIYRNGDYVDTVADTAYSDQTPSTGEFGYEIEVIKSSGGGHIVSAMAPVLNVSVDEINNTPDVPAAVDSGSVQDLQGEQSPQLGAATGVVETASVETFDEVKTSSGSGQVDSIAEAIKQASQQDSLLTPDEAKVQAEALVLVQTQLQAETSEPVSSPVQQSPENAESPDPVIIVQPVPETVTPAPSSLPEPTPQPEPAAQQPEPTVGTTVDIAAQTPAPQPAPAQEPSAAVSSPDTAAAVADAQKQAEAEAAAALAAQKAEAAAAAEAAAQAAQKAEEEAAAQAAAEAAALAEEQARLEAEAQAQALAEAQAKAEAEAAAKAEAQAQAAAEAAAKAEAEAQAKAEAEAAAAAAAALALANSQTDPQANLEPTTSNVVRDDYPNCKAYSSDPNGPPPNGVCPTTLPPSGPITVKKDNVAIRNLDIDSPSHEKCAIRIVDRKNITVENVNINHAGAGICIFGSENIKIKTVRMVNTITRPGPHCRPGLSIKDCKHSSRRSDPENLYAVNTHNNMWVEKSKNVVVDTVYMEKGEAGVFVHRTEGFVMNNFYCRDMRGPYWRGQCAMATESHGARFSKFYTQQFLDTSSGHDNISAYNSNNVTVTDGLVDGNWSRNGVAVIADKGAHYMTIKNVDVTRAGTAGVNVWSGAKHGDPGTIGKNFYVENVRVRDGHCDITWWNIEGLGPSSGGKAFSMHPDAIGAKYINSKYWNHCSNSAVFNHGNPAIKDIVEQNFKLKAPPIDINFPWLQY